jgi:hypothetical protein
MANEIETDFLKQIRAKSKDAMNWFRKLVKETQRAAFPASTGRKDLKTQSVDVRGNLSAADIGSMYFFRYQAKWADILPYWDMFPLIFPFAKATGGFYGINLHYLGPKPRIDLMRALIKAQGVSGNMDENFRLKLNYSIITKFPPAEPCIKRYLNSYNKGGFFKISGNDWAYAVGLPIQKWVVGNRPKTDFRISDKEAHSEFMTNWKG